MPSFAKAAYNWRFVTAVPPREVFAVMEQLLGTTPFRFEVTGDDQARVVEAERSGAFGGWRTAKRRVRWVTVTAVPSPEGTDVTVEASRSASRLNPLRNQSALTRALQLVMLLTRGLSDRRTIYRDRAIPAGPVTLVASWAGTPYPLFTEAAFDAPRGITIQTATRMVATGAGDMTFVEVRLADGTTGYVERDQIVPAPSEATRDAQLETARFG